MTAAENRTFKITLRLSDFSHRRVSAYFFDIIDLKIIKSRALKMVRFGKNDTAEMQIRLHGSSVISKWM